MKQDLRFIRVRFQGTNETLEGKPAQEMESGDMTPCGKGVDGAGSWWGRVSTELRLSVVWGRGRGQGTQIQTTRLKSQPLYTAVCMTSHCTYQNLSFVNNDIRKFHPLCMFSLKLLMKP